jgi:ribonuclease HII
VEGDQVAAWWQAASIIAKVTGTGSWSTCTSGSPRTVFDEHKGYATPEHSARR